MSDHSLSLRIDASAARKGSAEFVAAIEAIKRSIKGLEKDSSGAFTQLQKTFNAPVKTTSAKPQVAALESLNAASRKAESSVAILQRQLNKIGNAAGLQTTSQALASFMAELHTGVTTTAELRAAQDRLAQSLHGVREETRAASEVQRLRTAYQRTSAALDATSTGTHAYRRAVLATETALRSGAISQEQANRTLRQAKEAYLSAGAAAENAAAQQSRLFGTRAGWGALAGGGGRQIMLQVSQMAQVAGMATTVEQALKGVSYQAADVGLAFGPVGIAIGAVAGIALPLLIDRMFAADEAGKRLKDSIDSLNTAVGNYESAQKQALTANYDLTRQFGAQAGSARELYVALANLDRLDAMRKMAESATTVTGALSPMIDKLKVIRDMQNVRGSEIIVARRLEELRSEFGVTQAEAQQVKIALDQLATASGPDQYAFALKEVNRTLSVVKDRTGAIPVGLQDAARAAAEAALAALKLSGPLEQAWQSGSKLAALDMASGIRDAGAEAVFLASQLGVSLATARAISRQSGWFPDAKKGLTFGLPTTTNNPAIGGALPGTLGFGNNPGGGFGLPAPTRETTSSGGRSGGGGGSSVRTLADDLEQARKNALAARYAAESLGQGLYTTADAARLYGDAMAASGGKITDANRAAIASVDAINAQTEALDRARASQKALNDGLKSSFESLFREGKFGFQSLAESAISALSSILADSTTKAFLSLFDGVGKGGGLFGVIGQIFGFASGGYTGAGSKYQPAGIVHAGEFVMSKAATDRIGVGSLEALHNAALGGYAAGGFVTPAPITPPRPSRAKEAPGGNVSFGDIVANVTVEGGGTGDSAKDAEHAGRIAQATVLQLQQMVDTRIAEAARYGGLLMPRAA